MKEANVKSYTRRTKSGKTIKVKAHSHKCKGGCCGSEGAGKELSQKRASHSKKSTGSPKTKDILDYFQLPKNKQDERIEKLHKKLESAKRLPPSAREKIENKVKKVADRYVNFGYTGQRRRNLSVTNPEFKSSKKK